jgi:hypothetical protein
MIFLSASVPQPDRAFFGTENVYAIREAVISFVRVCAEKRLPFYFGGHPAITPLVWNVAKNYYGDKEPAIKIYQSRFFGDLIPREVEHFKNVCLTDAVGGNKDQSVDHMRQVMFEENPTDCAVFIGGMGGVVDEAHMIKRMYPEVRFLPLFSTGGAARSIYEEYQIDDDRLKENYAFYELFKEIL